MESEENRTGDFANDVASDKTIEEQSRDQTGQKRIRVRIDERNLQTSYISGFRPTITAEEVMLDFGLNVVRPGSDKEHPVEVVFQANNRIVMSYYSAKRLAIALTQVVKRYEQQFGAIELNAAKRRVDQSQ